MKKTALFFFLVGFVPMFFRILTSGGALQASDFVFCFVGFSVACFLMDASERRQKEYRLDIWSEISR